MVLHRFDELRILAERHAPWPRLALYPYGRADTRVVPQLHPEQLTRRGLPPSLAPTHLIVFDDRRWTRWTFEDPETRIDEEPVYVGTLGSHPCALSRIHFRSAAQSPRQLPDHSVYLFRIHAGVAQMREEMAWACFVPDIFIGLGDGCPADPRPGCLNALCGRPRSRPGTGYRAWDGEHWIWEDPRLGLVPQWWITDHFTHAVVARHALRYRRIVRSEQPGFLFQFHPFATLSRRWARATGGGPTAAVVAYRTCIAKATPHTPT